MLDTPTPTSTVVLNIHKPGVNIIIGEYPKYLTKETLTPSFIKEDPIQFAYNRNIIHLTLKDLIARGVELKIEIAYDNLYDDVFKIKNDKAKLIDFATNIFVSVISKNNDYMMQIFKMCYSAGNRDGKIIQQNIIKSAIGIE